MLSQRSPNTQENTVSELCNKIQKDELFALQSIYLSDFELTRAVHPYQFTVLVKPFVPDNHFTHQNLVFARLTIELPVEYPLQKQFFLFDLEGMTNHFTREFLKQAKDVCDKVIDEKEKEDIEGRGPIVFQMIETLRDWLFDQSTNFQEQYESAQKPATDNYLYIPAMPKFSTFTPVTLESFISWKKKFDAEMYEAKRRQKGFMEEDSNTKPTGRQFFLKENKKVEEELDDEDAVEVEDYEEEEDLDDEEEDEPQRLYQFDENEK